MALGANAVMQMVLRNCCILYLCDYCLHVCAPYHQIASLVATAGLDYLSAPTGPIKEAQELAARAFGADTTWFLVNGTTVGIQAAVMATCGPGDTLVLARNCHLAAFSGMVLTGCQPYYVQPGEQEQHCPPLNRTRTSDRLVAITRSESAGLACGWEPGGVKARGTCRPFS